MIEKMDPKKDGSSKDILQESIQKLRELFPEVFSENQIDFSKLQETLGEYIDDREERYNFTWYGKSQARRIAQTPSTGTLRPCKEESNDWETTKNLFIEGDNLEVLKLLQKSYHQKVKIIYIDPPYNTGGEFIYPDNYRDNLDTYLAYTRQKDGEGYRFSSNTEQSGRYHTNWLNMMYPRLKLARNLLRDDGIIFISIDDNEVANLRKLCDEIYGEENFIANIIWQKVFSPKNTAKHFSEDHDHVIVYAKSSEIWRPELLPRSEEAVARYKNQDNDPRGPWASSDLQARNYYSEGLYPVVGPSGREFRPGKGSYWRVSLVNFQKLDADNRIWWGDNGDNMPRSKRFLSEVKDGVIPQTLWPHSIVGHTQEAKKELLKYVTFEHTENVLNSVKPTKLLRHILKITTKVDTNDIVLDFFAGSAPTAHSVLVQNLEDQGNRRFISVQLPEHLKKEEKDVKTIFDLGKSRIQTLIKEIIEEKPNYIGDIGFKVFKLDSSNIKAWDADFDNLQKSLVDAIHNIKEDRKEDDVLYELLLKYGLDLTLPIEERIIAGKTVYSIGLGALVICLDSKVTLDVVEGIGKLKKELEPEIMRVVFRDNGFKDDVVKTNAIQILKQYDINDVKSL